MSFFNTISDWFNNTIVTSTYNPAADALKSLYRQNVSQNLQNLQSTISGLGGGLGSAITSIPGVGQPIIDALNTLQHDSENLLTSASSMTPDQIAAANDTINQKYQALLIQAQVNGNDAPPPPSTDKIGSAEYDINQFFSTIFSTTMYIIIFTIVIFLGFLGSSLASNASINNPIAYRIYYMIYGFILFPIPIIQSIFRFFNKEKLFYALWAPLHKGYTNNALKNIFLFPFIYSDNIGSQVSHFSSSSLVAQAQQLPLPLPLPLPQTSQQLLEIPSELQNPIVPIDLQNSFSRISFEPTQITSGGRKSKGIK